MKRITTTLILLMLVIAGSAKSTDIIFILDNDAAFHQGHIAVLIGCEINPKERHQYRHFKRIHTTAEEDSAALSASINTASVTLYGIIGPGQSCIDVAQNAFSALVKKRKLDKKGAVPGHTDLIPKRWFRKIEMRIKTANRRTKEGKGKITVMTDNERE